MFRFHLDFDSKQGDAFSTFIIVTEKHEEGVSKMSPTIYYYYYFDILHILNY